MIDIPTTDIAERDTLIVNLALLVWALEVTVHGSVFDLRGW